MRSLEVAARETNQPIKLIGDLSQAHMDVSHALLMQSHALLHVNDVLGLKFLYLGLTALDLRHHDRGVLKLPDFLFVTIHLDHRRTFASISACSSSARCSHIV